MVSLDLTQVTFKISPAHFRSHSKDSESYLSSEFCYTSSLYFILLMADTMTHRLTFPKMSFWCLGRSLTKGGEEGRTWRGTMASNITIIATDKCLLEADVTCADMVRCCCNIFTFYKNFFQTIYFTQEAFC